MLRSVGQSQKVKELKLNKLKTRVDDEEEFFIGHAKGPLGFTVKSRTVNSFSVHLNEEVKDASYYSKIFDLLLDAGENDTVNFFMASGGGDIEGLNILLEGVRLTDAHVSAVVLSACHSAASIFALNCHEVVVCDQATMLVHNIRTGYGGKIADLAAYADFATKTSSKLLKKTYKHFLSDGEIQEVLNGRELWLDADQIRERLLKRGEILEAEFEAEEKAKTAPKKTSRKKA